VQPSREIACQQLGAVVALTSSRLGMAVVAIIEHGKGYNVT
jgi:hypothetical protein